MANIKTEPGITEYTGDLDMGHPAARLFSKEDLEAEIKSRNMKNQILQQRGFVNQGLNVETNARLSMFEKEKIYPNQWTESTLNLLESWMSKARSASVAHAAAARVCRKKHRMLSLPTLVVGAVASALAFFSAGDTCDPDDSGTDALKYSTALFTSGLAILGGVAALYSFSDKMSQNIVASGNFANLATRIEVQIFLPNELRANSEVTLTDFSAQFENLVQVSPLL